MLSNTGTAPIYTPISNKLNTRILIGSTIIARVNTFTREHDYKEPRTNYLSPCKELYNRAREP